jgi:WD40 repeat protein
MLKNDSQTIVDVRFFGSLLRPSLVALAVCLLTGSARAQELATLRGHPGRLACVAFAPDGKTVATGGHQAIKVWEVATGKERASFETFDTKQDWAFALEFISDGETLAAACGDSRVKRYDLASGKEVESLGGKNGYSHTVACAPGGKVLAGEVSGVVNLWDAATGKETTSWKIGSYAHGLAFAPDGKTLATADYGGNAILWEADSGKEVRRFKVKKGAAYTVTFAPDGKTVVTTSDGPTQVWNVATGKEEKLPDFDGAEVRCVAFSADGKRVATGTKTRELQLRDAATWKLLATVPDAHDGDGFGALAFSPDGKVLATAGYDRIAKLWDVEKILRKR